MYNARSAFAKLKGKVLSYSEMEMKVREATNTEVWGASTTMMRELADATHDFSKRAEILRVLWSRLNESGKNWRVVYKSLTLLEYLIAHGSEHIASEARYNIFKIRTLNEFSYKNPETEADEGVNVRHKAKGLVDLINDDNRIRDEREKASRVRKMGIGQKGASLSSGNGHSMSSSSSRAAPPSSSRSYKNSNYRGRGSAGGQGGYDGDRREDREGPTGSLRKSAKPIAVKIAAPSAVAPAPVTVQAPAPSLIGLGAAPAPVAAPEAAVVPAPVAAPAGNDPFASFGAPAAAAPAPFAAFPDPSASTTPAPFAAFPAPATAPAAPVANGGFAAFPGSAAPQAVAPVAPVVASVDPFSGFSSSTPAPVAAASAAVPSASSPFATPTPSPATNNPFANGAFASPAVAPVAPAAKKPAVAGNSTPTGVWAGAGSVVSFSTINANHHHGAPTAGSSSTMGSSTGMGYSTSPVVIAPTTAPNYNLKGAFSSGVGAPQQQTQAQSRGW